MSLSFDAAVELDHANEVYDWCIAAADRLGEDVPPLVRDFFNYKVPAVLALIRQAESRPVSSPPKRPAQYGPMPSLGSVHAACTPDSCQTVADRVQLADDVPTRDAHLAGDHSLCQAQWCADATLPSAEAGIAPEDIDAELNGHEPTPFADGGAR